MYGIPPEQMVGSFALGGFSLSAEGTQINKTMQGALINLSLCTAQTPVGRHAVALSDSHAVYPAAAGNTAVATAPYFPVNASGYAPPD